jgi:hypothetical protein
LLAMQPPGSGSAHVVHATPVDQSGGQIPPAPRNQ